MSRFLEADGWHSIENLSGDYSFAFQKNDFRVVVQYGGMRTANYGITCTSGKKGRE
ncbi:MAG: hypothetical protein ACJ72Z_09935 [Pyrinomonadaceae bacterium]